MVGILVASFGGLGLCVGMAFLVDTLFARIFRLPEAHVFAASESLATASSPQS